MKNSSHESIKARHRIVRAFALILAFVPVIFYVQKLPAQNFETKFGKCSQDELELKVCPFDSLADAMVLYDVGETRLESLSEKYYVIFERKIKFKFFNKAGLEHADFEIDYYDGKEGIEKVTAIKCNTYNIENGKVVVTKLENKNIFEEKLANRWLRKKFAMPGVKEGSVVEISYDITSPYIFSLPSWEFQMGIPVMYSHLTATLNQHFEYTFIKKGDLKLDDYKRYESTVSYAYFNTYKKYDIVHEYIMKNVPAFNDEIYITSKNDYINKVDIQLSRVVYSDGNYDLIMSTWPKLSEELYFKDNFGGYIKSFSRGNEITRLISALPLDSTFNKAKFIDEYIKNNYTYNGDQQYLTSGSKNDIEKSKKGNCADLNLMAVGLLKAAGYTAYPAMLSTRENGKVNSMYPFLDNFNYVIAVYYDNNEMRVMDVTEPLMAFGTIPPKCLNDVCLLLKDKEIEWLSLSSQKISDLKYLKTLTPLPESDSMLVQSNLTATYFDAYNLRKEYISDYHKLATDLIGEDYSLYDSITCNKLENMEEPFELSYNRKQPLEAIDNMILIEPFEGEVITENPLKQPVRNYPIDIGYRYSKTFSVDIIIPEGYKIASIPESLTVNNKDIKIVYTVIQKEPSKVNVIGLYQFKKDVYHQSSYNDMRGYLDMIVNKFNEKLVLESTEI